MVTYISKMTCRDLVQVKQLQTVTLCCMMKNLRIDLGKNWRCFAYMEKLTTYLTYCACRSRQASFKNVQLNCINC